jgi:hypothetical protein
MIETRALSPQPRVPDSGAAYLDLVVEPQV